MDSTFGTSPRTQVLDLVSYRRTKKQIFVGNYHFSGTRNSPLWEIIDLSKSYAKWKNEKLWLAALVVTKINIY